MTEKKSAELKPMIARVDPELHRRIMVLAAEQGTTLQALVTEAVEDLLRKYEQIKKGGHYEED